MDTDWQVPNNPESPRDLEASHRAIAFMFGWFLNPLIEGEYPKVMRDQVNRKSQEQGLSKSRLPEFTEYDKKFIKGVISLVLITVMRQLSFGVCQSAMANFRLFIVTVAAYVKFNRTSWTLISVHVLLNL